MKVWGLLLCVVLVATLACVVAAPEGVLPEAPPAEEVPSAEPIDVTILQRACSQPWCSNICLALFGCTVSRCTAPNTCTCYC